MICKSCGEAGDLLSATRMRDLGPVHPNLKTLALDVIRLKHQECPGHDACDCLHRLS